jgi:hypothetical protein
MLKPTAAKSLFVSLLAVFTLACTPNVVFGQHGRRGSHGGGGSHRGGSHFGGHFDRGGGGGFRGRRGFRGGTSGRYRGGSSRPGRSAPSQMGGSSGARSGRFSQRPYGNSSHAGGRGVRSSDLWHSFANTPRTTPNAFAPRASFDPGRTSLARTPYTSGSHQSRSLWTNTPKSRTSFDSDRPPSARSTSRNWPRQDRRSSWAFNQRPASTFDSNRPPTATSFHGNWSRQSRPSSASALLSTVPQNSNRAPGARLASRSWSGPNRSFSGNASGPASYLNFNRGFSNFRNTRFGDSRLGGSSFADSRFGSHGSSSGRSRFAGGHPFHQRGAAFGREASFGGGDSFFVPDLFGWALGLGTLAVTGLDLLGPGLTAFGLRGLGFLGWGLLDSVSGESGSETNLQSPYFAPCPTLYPTGNWVCQQ